MPAAFKYSADSTPVSYSGPDGETIEKGTTVRVQILGLRSDVEKIHAIGKMSGGWFG